MAGIRKQFIGNTKTINKEVATLGMRLNSFTRGVIFSPFVPQICLKNNHVHECI